jgi:hypothetical protein
MSQVELWEGGVILIREEPSRLPLAEASKKEMNDKEELRDIPMIVHGINQPAQLRSPVLPKFCRVSSIPDTRVCFGESYEAADDGKEKRSHIRDRKPCISAWPVMIFIETISIAHSRPGNSSPLLLVIRILLKLFAFATAAWPSAQFVVFHYVTQRRAVPERKFLTSRHLRVWGNHSSRFIPIFEDPRKVRKA